MDEIIVSPRKKQFTLMARIDWLLFLNAMFPYQVSIPFLLLFSPYSSLALPEVFFSILRFVLIFLFLITIGFIFDTIRGLFIAKGKLIDEGTFNALSKALSDYIPTSDILLLKNLHTVKSDLSLGAQVRGIIRPRIVISGGLLVGLLRKEPLALSVLIHEIAHIRHFDRFLPALIALSMFEFIGRQAILILDYLTIDAEKPPIGLLILIPIYQIIVFSITISFISKYREFYADAKSIQSFKNITPYLALLDSATEKSRKFAFHFFHPTPKRRTLEAKNGHPVLTRSIFWKVYWPLNALISWGQWEYADEEYVSFYGQNAMIVSIACFIFEIFRKPLLFASNDFISSCTSIFNWLRPGKRFARYAFMLTGFIFVIFLDNTFGDKNKTWMWLGGAIVYSISRSMK